MEESRVLQNEMLPVEIVLHPSWWHKHEGIVFDEDFFFHPLKRVEAERKMEQVLHERFGRHGLGADCDQDLPLVGAVHNAAGFMISEMLGCTVRYEGDGPPQVLCDAREGLSLKVEDAFESPVYRKFESLCGELKRRFGYLAGDVNFGGVLNCALDLRGQDLFLDIYDCPETLRTFFKGIAECIDRFTRGIQKDTGTTSLSVNRTLRHIQGPVFLHSECTHAMISVEHYETFLAPFDHAWSLERRPFGIHYCGEDPHRFGSSFAKLPHLDFLDVGWGGDLKILRQHLPRTFLNIRMSPVEIVNQSEAQIHDTIVRLVKDSKDPYLTGVCCINMDDRVEDKKISVIFETVEELRRMFEKED